MSGTACCYKGCVKSYSQDKDVSFFKFPDDPKRRKKWMEHCDNAELLFLSDRQLRLKRVCSDHFSPFSFMSAETRNQLTEKAVPLSQIEYEAAVKAQKDAEKEEGTSGKRGRGRPKGFSLVLVKKEPDEVINENQEQDEEEEEEDDEEVEDEDEEDEEEDVPSENGDTEYNPPPQIRRQTGGSFGRPGRPPKALNNSSNKIKPKGVDSHRKSKEKRMTDLSVIESVIRDMAARKRPMIGPDERILNKRLKSASFEDGEEDDELLDSDEDMDDMDEEDDDEYEGPERANREFERFQAGLRKVIKLPQKWGMGAVIWDPLNKMKVIAISESNVLPNGAIRLLRAIQIFEDSSVKVTIDGVNMTLNFGLTSIETEGDVNQIITSVAESRICSGVKSFQPDDIIYQPDARKRGCSYYAEACPVILDQNVIGNVCNPCTALEKDVLCRKQKEKAEMVTRRSRPMAHQTKNDFGRAIYGFLHEILDDSNILKSDDKDAKEAVMSKYTTEIQVNGEVQKPEKIPQVHVSVDEVSASFAEIVNKLGFNLKRTPGSATTSSTTSLPVRARPREGVNDGRNSMAQVQRSFMAKFNNNKMPARSGNSNTPNNSSTPISNSGTSFSLADGQTYEIVGEVGGSDTKGEAIEIIEVDDETMAKLTAQNSGMLFQNSATLESNDPNISNLLKSINSSQNFKET